MPKCLIVGVAAMEVNLIKREISQKAMCPPYRWGKCFLRLNTQRAQTHRLTEARRHKQRAQSKASDRRVDRLTLCKHKQYPAPISRHLSKPLSSHTQPHPSLQNTQKEAVRIRWLKSIKELLLSYCPVILPELILRRTARCHSDFSPLNVALDGHFNLGVVLECEYGRF